MEEAGFQYDKAGVDTDRAQGALGRLATSINSTFSLRDGRGFGRPVMGLGYYANVLELPGGQGLAISADGVGTKIIVAEMVGRYDTIGIDLIAMNVNDLICVGAEPFAMVDYIAVGEINDKVFDQIGQGLLRGSEESGITIPGGEIAQVAELIRGHGDSKGIDLVGAAVGLVNLENVNVGADAVAGDVVVGLAASGLHSNGFTLARQILLDEGGYDLHSEIPALGHCLGDELLEPTQLYVKPILQMLKEGVEAHALLHITGDGFCNMNRIQAQVGFDLDAIPTPGPIYGLLQETGSISDQEMFSVFNMGIGFCVVTPEAHAERVIAIAKEAGIAASVIGRATDQHLNEVRLSQYGLIGGKDRLAPE